MRYPQASTRDRRSRRLSVLARLLASSILAPWLQGCAVHAPPRASVPAGGVADARSSREAPVGSEPDVEAGTPEGRPRVAPVRLTTQITRIASLVHFVDSLADTSGGKSVPMYRALWNARIGPPTDEDRSALAAFRAARLSQTAAARCGDPAPGSVNAHGGWPTRFLYTVVEAEDLEGFLAQVRPCLTADEARGLEGALAHFEPGFETFWREAGWLRTFDGDFQEYLQSGGLLLYLGEVARWFGVDPAKAPPPVIAFVLLPAEGGTHAQELGQRLLVEVRPHDTPVDQLAVVAHEETHYLFYQIPADRLAALAARAQAAGPDGARIWRLLHEAIPTALGQGLAVARLKRDGFRPDLGWYHVAEIDVLAHLIYPLVRDAMDSGRTIDGDFIDACVRAYDRWEETQGAPPAATNP